MQAGSELRLLDGSLGFHAKPMKTPSVKREFTFVIASKAVMCTLVNEDEIAISVSHSHCQRAFRSLS